MPLMMHLTQVLKVNTDHSSTPDYLQQLYEQPPAERIFYTETMSSIHTRVFVDPFSSAYFPSDVWHDFVRALTIDLEMPMQVPMLDEVKLPQIKERFTFARDLFASINDLISDYQKERAVHHAFKEISTESLRNYLYLYPFLASRSPRASIDSDTGFFNAGLVGKNSSLLNALITDFGEIHYSLVGRSKRIFKITGVAKIKDSEDFKQFKRVVRML